MSQRAADLHAGPANPAELPAALRLAFQHLDAAGCDSRVAQALALVHAGELDPAGVWVARDGTGLVGAMIATPIPGAGGLVWPPQALPGPRQAAAEDQLVQGVGAWLRQRGARLAQALLVPAEVPLAAPLCRNGFAHVTGLWYMRHPLQGVERLLAGTERLEYRTYTEADPALFHATLLRTYEDTLDCPEVSGVRTVVEVIAGHQAQGCFRPERWWLGLLDGRPAGVLMLTVLPDWQGWDISYVGVVPEFRRRGLGRELLARAALEARAAEAPQLTLSVDERNGPALGLYQALGFETYDRREVYLAIWGRATAEQTLPGLEQRS